MAADIFLHSLTVPASALDMNRHVNNLEYLKWMQQAAIMHSGRLGWPPKRYMLSGYSWVIGSHNITYMRPAFEADPLAIITWIADVKGRTSTRKYLCINKETKKILARAETWWVFIRGRDGKPCRIIDEVRTAYDVVATDDDVKEFIARLP